jgi:hypothetical protein
VTPASEITPGAGELCAGRLLVQTRYLDSQPAGIYMGLFQAKTIVSERPGQPQPHPLPFGRSSKFGFKNPFQFFNLLQPGSV